MPQPTPASSRIITFDLLRGWFLVVIAFDHLNRHPALFDLITGKSLLWVTAAEGFFFVSGLLVGIIRRRQAERQGLWPATRKLWSRAAKLYAATVVLTVLYSYVAYRLTAHGVVGVKDQLRVFDSFWPLLGNALILRYVYGWTDFLPYYAVYLFLSPLALWALVRGRWRWVIGLVLLVWVGKGFVSTGQIAPYLLWQAYFFSGLVVGFQYDRIHARYRGLSATTARRLRYGIVAAAASTIVLSQLLTFVPVVVQNRLDAQVHDGPAATVAWAAHDAINDVTQTRAYDALFYDNRQGPVRLPVFLLWTTALFLCVRRYEAALRRTVGKLLIPLGANSLYVYIVQSAFLFTIPLVGLPVTYALNTLVTVVFVAILWLMVRSRFLFAIIPR